MTGKSCDQYSFYWVVKEGMERLSEVPAVNARTIRRGKSLTDVVPVFDGSSASQFSWRSVFQRKTEFERLLQHRMNHSSVGLLPALSRSNSAVGREQAKRRQLSGRRILGQPRSANAAALASLQVTQATMPPRVNAVDLTCLEITTAVMTSPTLSQRHRFAYERLDYIKRNHPDNYHVDKSCDLKPELISNGVPVRRSLSFTRSVSNYKLESKAPPNGVANSVYEDAMELKSIIKDSKQKKATSAVSRVDVTQKPLCDRKANPDVTQKPLCGDRKVNSDVTQKPWCSDRETNSASSKKSSGKSILKRIREKFEKDIKLTPAKEPDDKRPAGKNIKDVSFDGISSLKTCIAKNKHPVQVKRRKDYRLFGSASTHSSQRSVRFSASDTIYEYDSET